MPSHSGYQQSRAINEFAFDDDRIEKLLKVWLFYDPDGKGCISAKDYIKLIVSLKPPLKIDTDAIGRKLQEMENILGNTYKGFYPFNNDVDYQMNRDNKMLAGVSSQSRYYRSDDDSISLSVNQYFLMCRVYNVPVYPIDRVGHVHFMDVAAVLSRLIIEARYPDIPPMEFTSESIETMLVDKWASRYTELSTFLANKQKLKFDEDGKLRRPLDLLHTQAVRVVLNANKKELEKNAMRLNNEQNKRLLVFREFEEEMNMKIEQHAEVSVQIQKKIINDQIVSDYLRHQQIKKASKMQSRTDPKPNLGLLDSGSLTTRNFTLFKPPVGSMNDFGSFRRVSKVFDGVQISQTTRNTPVTFQNSTTDLTSKMSPTRTDFNNFTDALKKTPSRVSMLFTGSHGPALNPPKENGVELWPTKYLIKSKIPAHDRGPAFLPESEQIPEIKNFDNIGLVFIQDGLKDESLDFHDIEAAERAQISVSLSSSEDQRYVLEKQTDSNPDSPFLVDEANLDSPVLRKTKSDKKNKKQTEPQLIKVKKMKYIPKVGTQNQFEEDARSSSLEDSSSIQRQPDLDDVEFEVGEEEEGDEEQSQNEEEVVDKGLDGFHVDPLYQDDSDKEAPKFERTPQLGSSKREDLSPISKPGNKPPPATDSNTLNIFSKQRNEKQYTFNGYTSDDSRNA